MAVVLASAALATAWVASSAPKPVPRIRAGLVRQGEFGSRLRVFARAGDYKLESPHLVAVVRKRDGFEACHVFYEPTAGWSICFDGGRSCPP